MEVVGLVLGIIPLINNALEGYQKLRKKRDAFTRKSLHIDRMKHVLARQYRLVHSDLVLILRSADIDAVLVEDDLLASGIATLQRPDVQGAVQEYLGVHYHDYMEAVKDCENVLLQILSTITSVSEGSWVGRIMTALPNAEVTLHCRLLKAPWQLLCSSTPSFVDQDLISGIASNSP
jgi:hypothetical protein